MIHPRKYEEYELGVLVIHAKHDQKLGLWVEVSVAPAKKDKGCGLEEGLDWWCIPERVKSMGSGCGLEVHLEIWGFFFWKDMQEAECIVLGWTAAWTEVPASTRDEALFHCAEPSRVPRGPANYTASLTSQRHRGKFTKVPCRSRGKRGFPAATRETIASSSALDLGPIHSEILLHARRCAWGEAGCGESEASSSCH